MFNQSVRRAQGQVTAATGACARLWHVARQSQAKDPTFGFVLIEQIMKQDGKNWPVGIVNASYTESWKVHWRYWMTRSIKVQVYLLIDQRASCPKYAWRKNRHTLTGVKVVIGVSENDVTLRHFLRRAGRGWLDHSFRGWRLPITNYTISPLSHASLAMAWRVQKSTLCQSSKPIELRWPY